MKFSLYVLGALCFATVVFCEITEEEVAEIEAVMDDITPSNTEERINCYEDTLVDITQTIRDLGKNLRTNCYSSGTLNALTNTAVDRLGAAFDKLAENIRMLTTSSTGVISVGFNLLRVMSSVLDVSKAAVRIIGTSSGLSKPTRDCFGLEVQKVTDALLGFKDCL